MKPRSRSPAADEDSNGNPLPGSSARYNGRDASSPKKKERNVPSLELPNDRGSKRSSFEGPFSASDNIPEARRWKSVSPRARRSIEKPGVETHVKVDNHDRMSPSRTRKRAPRSAWSCSFLIVALTAFSAAITYVILQSFLTKQRDPVGCSMSWMNPSWANFSDFDTEHTRFASKYHLYLYRENGIDEDSRVKGVPVLFIPGNAGSFRQARPIAAQAAKYYHEVLRDSQVAKKAGKRPLDVFSVDFNEDITAFHGQTLLDQAEYLNDALTYILSLYHNPYRSSHDPELPDPTSVIIVGHSMGGIVARTMLTLPNYQSGSINTIITLSAPHARAPVSFDADIVRTYKRINDYWRHAYSQKWANNNPLWHVTLISIAGGGLDTVVPSDYSTLASLVPPTHGFTVFTSTIPEVWTGMDHLAITWCNQLREKIVDSLYEVIDATRSSQTRSRAERMSAFKKHFLTGMEDFAERSLPFKEPQTLLTLDDSSNSIISQGERLILRQLGNAGGPKPYILPIPPQSSFDRKEFTLLTDQKISGPDEPGPLEVLFCSVFPLHTGQTFESFTYNIDFSGDGSGSTRLACKNAALDTILLPSSTRFNRQPFDNYLWKDENPLYSRTPPFSYLQYNVNILSEHQFVAIIDRSDFKFDGWVIAEFASRSESNIEVNRDLPTLISSGLDLTLAERPMTVEVSIPAVHSSLLSYKLSTTKQSCGENPELFPPLLRQHISEPYESKFFVNFNDADISLHGVAPFIPPSLKRINQDQGLSLQIWSDPSCNNTMEVSMQVDILGSMGKLWMRYRTVLAVFPLIVVALVLRKQFKVYDQDGSFVSFSEGLDLSLRGSIPFLLLALTLFTLPLSSRVADGASGVFGGAKSNITESVIDFAKNDLLLGSHDPFFWFLVPLFGSISIGICIVLNYTTLILVQSFVFISSQISRRLIRNTERLSSSASPNPVRRRVITLIILLVFVSTVIPYQFVYLVLCIVHLASCIRALTIAKENPIPSNIHFFNYAHSILILMLWILPINLPTLVVWIHNITVHWLTPFSSHHNILSIMPFVLLVETISSGSMIARIPSRIRHVTSTLLFVLAVYAGFYGVTYAYLLHYIVNILCTWLFAIHFADSGTGLNNMRKMFEGITGEERRGNVKKQP